MEKQDIIIIIAGIVYCIITILSGIYFWNKGEEYYQRTHEPYSTEKYDVFDDPGALAIFSILWPILWFEIGCYKLYCVIKGLCKRLCTRQK